VYSCALFNIPKSLKNANECSTLSKGDADKAANREKCLVLIRALAIVLQALKRAVL